MNKQQSLIAKLLLKHQNKAEKYAEGGSAGARGRRDQVATDTGYKEATFGSKMGDIGKYFLNTVTTPFETVTGWEFYDPKFSDTKFGSQTAKVSSINEGITSIATDVAGTALLGPGYAAGKSALTTGFDAMGAEDQYSGQIAKHGGHIKKYFNGANVTGDPYAELDSLLTGPDMGGENQAFSGHTKEGIRAQNKSAREAMRWNKVNNPSAFAGPDWEAALMGTDRNFAAIGNPNQAAGVMDAFGKLQGKTPDQIKAEEIYQSNVSDVNSRDGRNVTVYGQEGTQAGITGDKDPTAQMKLNNLRPPGSDMFGKISQGLKMAGDLYASGKSGFSGGQGPEWSKMLGEGNFGNLDSETINQGLEAAGKILKKKDGGHIPKMSYDLGGGVGSSIGQFYGGVNAAFLDVRDKKHKSGGHSYKEGSDVEKKGTTTLPVNPEGTLIVPENFQGYFPIPGGEERSHASGNDIDMITPAEAEGQQRIKVEGGEGADVSNGETFIIPKGKKKKEYEAIKEKEEKYAKLLQDNELQRDNKQKKFDDIELQTVEKKLNNEKIKEAALREEIVSEKKAKEAKRLGELQRGPGGQLLAGLMQEEGMNPQAMATGGETKKQLEQRGMIPGAAYLGSYAEGRRNTQDWYDRVNTGDLKPTNYYEGTLDKSINYLQDALDKRLPASQRRMEANLQKQITAANQTVQNNVNSAAIQDARLRKNWATGMDKQAGIADVYGKLGLQYEDKIAGLLGEQDKIERTALEKQLEQKRVDWGDYKTAVGEDIDELAPILSNLQKNRMQAAINQQLADQLDDTGQGTTVSPIDKKNLQNDNQEEVVEETTSSVFSEDKDGNKVPDYLEKEKEVFHGPEEGPEEIPMTEEEIRERNALIDKEVFESDPEVREVTDKYEEITDLENQILEDRRERISEDERLDNTLTKEAEERRRMIEEEVFNTSPEGREIQEKVDEASEIEKKVLKDNYGIEPDEWSRKVGEVPVPEDDYSGWPTDDDLIREATQEEEAASIQRQMAEQDQASIDETEEIIRELDSFIEDEGLSDEEKKQKAERENQLAAGLIDESEELRRLEPIEAEDPVLKELNLDLQKNQNSTKQSDIDNIVDFLQDFETTQGGVEQNDEGEWVTTGLSQYEGEEGAKKIRKYLGKDFIETDRNGRKKYGIKHYVPEFDDLDYNTKGLLAEYNLNQSWDPRVLILLATGNLSRAERGAYHRDKAKVDALWKTNKEDALSKLANSEETLAKLVEERNLIIDNTFQPDEDVEALTKEGKKSRIYPSTSLRKKHFTGKD